MLRINSRSIGIAVVVIAVTWVGLKFYLSRPLPPITVPPAPRMPAENAFDDCVRASSMLRNADTARKLVPADNPGGAEDLLRRNRDALVIVRRSLDKQFVTPRPEHWDDKLTYLDGFRQIGDLFRLEGDLKASHGDCEGAAVSFVDARRFGAAVPRGGWLIHWASGLYISSRGYYGLEKISGKLDADTCRYVLSQLHCLDTCERPLKDTLDGEEVFGLMFLRDVQQGKFRGRDPKDFGPMPPIADRLIGRGRPSLDRFEEQMRLLRAESAKPFYLRQPLPKPKGIWTEFLVPEPELLTKASIASTRAQIVKLMIGLRLYRLEHGEYPDSLAELQPSNLVIIDEFAGYPLLYKKTSDGYLLYSIGPDRKDDGGKPLDKANHGDIVAGKLFTR